MRLLAGVVVGIGIGFAGGYALARPPAEGVRAAAVAPRTAPLVHAAAAPEAPPVSSSPAARRGPLIVRFPRDGVVSLDNIVIIDDGEVLACGPRPLAEVRQALADARAAADWAAYYAALTEAGTAGTREAEELLVEVMGDETLSLEGYRTGKSFRRWLADSDVKGIVEAARLRARIDIDDEPDDSCWRGVGWLALVALRGSEADLDWLEAHGRGDTNTEMDVDRALAEGARNPLAAARLLRRMREPGRFRWSRRIEALESSSPEAALAAALGALPEVEDQKELLRFVGEATTPFTIEATRAALLSLRDGTARGTALRAVGRLRDRGLDVSGFEDLVDEPRLLLERVASRPLDGDEAGEVREAIDVIRDNPVTWCDAATAALRAYAGHEDPGIAKAADEALLRITKSSGRGREWVPERGPAPR
jgi:hypothetical protein